MTNEERAIGYTARPPQYGTGPERYTPAQNRRLRHKAHSRKTHTHTVPRSGDPGSEPGFGHLPDFRCPRCRELSSKKEDS